MTAYEIPPVGSAEVHVLHNGYAGLDGDGERACGTVTLVIDSGAVTLADPGMAFSHHHPDHTVNAAPFPAARIHDHWAVYEGDRWLDPAVLTVSRELPRALATVIIPGHGAPFRLGEQG